MSHHVRVENVTRGTVVAERVRVARSSRDRTVGLLGRDGLPDGEGLWIERSPSNHMFFMRFAIDAVFVGADGRVTKVVPDLGAVAGGVGGTRCSRLPRACVRGSCP
jgi:hypothetical protein